MKRYRTIVAALLLFAMLLPLSACGEVENETTQTRETTTAETKTAGGEEESAMPLKEYAMGSLRDSIKVLGERTGFSGDEMLAEWSGSGFEMNVNVGDEGTDLKMGFRCNYAARWKVYVDGEQWGDRVTTTTGNRKIIVARGIPAGVHTIRFVKDSQPNTSRNNYNSILTLALNGEILTPPEEKGLYLEFIGDGYMTGFGALGKSGNSSAVQILEETSVTAALPYLVSQTMDADYSIVAHSQIGLKVKAGSFNMPSLYANRYAYRELDVQYEPTRVPDAIVIHLGMDDTLTDLTMGNFIVTAKDFITSVRDYYGGAKIPVVWLYNTMYHTNRSGEIQALVRYMGGESAGVYALEMYYGASGSGTAETDRYPSAEEHQKSADILVPFLKDLLGR